MSPTILVVDPDHGTVAALTNALAGEGFSVRPAEDARNALDRARGGGLDGLVLEIDLAGMDGFELLRRLRDRGVAAPGVFVSKRDGLEDRLQGLAAGADDYVTKPFSPEEVAARLTAILRRTSARSALLRTPLTVGDLVLNEDSYEVVRADKSVALSPLEFRLLRYLMINAGTVLSKPAILEHVWNHDLRTDATVVESYVCSLRRKVAHRDRPLIHTVRGVGYVLRARRATPGDYRAGRGPTIDARSMIRVCGQ